MIGRKRISKPNISSISDFAKFEIILCDILQKYEILNQEKKDRKLKIGELCKINIQKLIPLGKNNNIEDIDLIFIQAENERIIKNKYSNFFNDITDYINFRYAWKHCSLFYSQDSKFFRPLPNVFKEPALQNFISSSKKLSKIE